MLPPSKTMKKDQNNHPAMTATKRLLAGLREGKMADVELVGDDGIRVPALRCVLACASPVMHNLLYGEPTRASSPTIKIAGCSNKTLRALVEYCCSDELNASIWDGSCPPAEIVKDIVALARVAHAYGIPNVEERVLEGINPLMGAIPPLACVVFNYADPSTTRDIHISALDMIRAKPYICLQQEGQNVGGMVCLSPDKLQEIIRDSNLQVDELFLFKQIMHWRAFNKNTYANTTAICKQLVSFIDLTYIDPSDVKAFVIDSGLVEDKVIIEALLEQAISATKEGLAFAAMRGTQGKDNLYAMVHNAGTPECNGLYKQVRREGALLCYGKVINEKRMMLLLKDTPTTWKICDQSNIYFEWKSNDDSNYDKFPLSGWVSTGRAPSSSPHIRWYRPRGKSPRLPASMPPKAPATSRIPIECIPPFEPRSSPGEDGLPNNPLRQHLRPNHHSMDEYDASPRSSCSSPALGHVSPQHFMQSPQPQQQKQRLQQQQQQQQHAQHSPNGVRQQHQQHQHHQRHPYPRRSAVDDSPRTPVAVRISPRTPSPQLGFASMPSLKESVTWAV